MNEPVLLALISVIGGGIITQAGNFLVARVRAARAVSNGPGFEGALARHLQDCPYPKRLQEAKQETARQIQETRGETAHQLEELRDDLTGLLAKIDRHIEYHLSKS